MFNEEIFREEEMFREEDLARLAELPTLSPELRVRMLAAVTEARQRRSQGRRVLASLLVLSAAMVWGAWTGPLSIMSNPSAMTSVAPVSLRGTTAQDSSGSAFSIVHGVSIVHGAFTDSSSTTTYSRSDRLVSAMGDDWLMVDAELKSREEFTRRVQM